MEVLADLFLWRVTCVHVEMGNKRISIGLRERHTLAGAKFWNETKSNEKLASMCPASVQRKSSPSVLITMDIGAMQQHQIWFQNDENPIKNVRPSSPKRAQSISLTGHSRNDVQGQQRGNDAMTLRLCERQSQRPWPLQFQLFI